MNADLIKEILRRVEAKHRAENEDPAAWIELFKDESWSIKVQDDFGEDWTAHIGQGLSELSNLLADLRSK